MNEREFCYWLQGVFEVQGIPEEGFTKEQIELIYKHLQLVFTNVTKRPLDLEGIKQKKPTLDDLRPYCKSDKTYC